MKSYFFTFGTNHLTEEKESLGQNYVKIKAKSELEARKTMFTLRGDNWSHSYTEKEFEGQIKEFDLKEKTIKEITLSNVD